MPDMILIDPIWNATCFNVVNYFLVLSINFVRTRVGIERIKSG